MPLGFGPGRPATPSPHLRELKEAVRTLLGLDEDTAVVIRQPACTEPDCPPLETVVVGSPVAALTWAGSHLLITAHGDGRVRAHSVPSRAEL